MKVKRYFQESFTELVYKVTWPTWKELQNSTTVVLIASVIIAITVALMDFGFKEIMGQIYKLLY